MAVRFVILFLCLALGQSMFGQSYISDKAQKYLDLGLYRQALQQYELISDKNDKEVEFSKAICHYELNHLKTAKRLFYNIGQKDLQNPEVAYYLARIAHHELEFNVAIRNYKEFLKRAKRDDPKRREVIDRIKRCATGRKVQLLSQRAFVENLGPDVNTASNDFGLVASPNFSDKYYFSSDREFTTGGLRDGEGLKDIEFGHYFADIFTLNRQNGVWKDVDKVNTLVNSAQHDVVWGFGNEGNSMYISKSLDMTTQSILKDEYNGSADSIASPPEPFISTIDGQLGDNYLSIVNDSLIIFSSRREGGYGGYDLYVVASQGGKWSEPLNLGPVINTPYDEICPFLAHDKTKIFFSSNSLSSIGGFDIFESQFSAKENQWTIPINLGLPFNSAADDTHFGLVQGGAISFFTSDRKDGYGGKDLYVGYLKSVETAHIRYQNTIAFLPFRSVEDDVDIPNIDLVENEPIKAVEPRKLILKPLQYDEDDVILTPQNKQQLDALAQQLKIYPNLLLEIECHGVDEGSKAFELYFSIKRAESVAEYLNKKGEFKDRIWLKGLGKTYPVVINQFSNNSAMTRNLNRRMELRLHKTKDYNLQVEYDRQRVVESMKSRAYDIYNTVRDGLSYRVEIASVHQMYQSDLFNLSNDIAVEKLPNSDEYLYVLGIFSNFQKANDFQETIPQSTSVIPYIDGIRIENKNIFALSQSYPDLLNFLKSGQ